MSFRSTRRAAAAALCAVVLCAARAGRADYYSEMLAGNPLAYWRLGEASGRAAHDEMRLQDGTHRRSVGKGRPGAISGDPDTSVYFRRSYAEIAHPDDMLLDGGAVQLCFKDTGTLRTEGLLSKDSCGSGTGGHLTIAVQDKKVRARLQSTTAGQDLWSDKIRLDTWDHVVFTFGDQGMKLHRNGERVDTDSYTGGLAAASGGIGNYEPIVLGAATWHSGNRTGTLALLGLGGALLIVRKRRRAARA